MRDGGRPGVMASAGRESLGLGSFGAGSYIYIQIYISIYIHICIYMYIDIDIYICIWRYHGTSCLALFTILTYHQIFNAIKSNGGLSLQHILQYTVGRWQFVRDQHRNTYIEGIFGYGCLNRWDIGVVRTLNRTPQVRSTKN